MVESVESGNYGKMAAMALAWHSSKLVKMSI
jgi:hypothetical protein